jgi:hypothetical protein
VFANKAGSRIAALLLELEMKKLDQDTGDFFSLCRTEAWQRDRQAFENSSCQHSKAELRKWTYSNGSAHYRLQCLTCGEAIGQSMSQNKITQPVAEADQTLKERYQDQRNKARLDIDQKHIRIQRAEGNIYRKEYEGYRPLRSLEGKTPKSFTKSEGNL